MKVTVDEMIVSAPKLGLRMYARWCLDRLLAEGIFSEGSLSSTRRSAAAAIQRGLQEGPSQWVRQLVRQTDEPWIIIMIQLAHGQEVSRAAIVAAHLRIVQLFRLKATAIWEARMLSQIECKKHYEFFLDFGLN